ncbi:uncharacterized protein B0I36DRAFT_30741 [Microdochium trichocladiopsis]|uniref:Uncharacterized protein n=1 Tax=Microdochium trichocladiopsis TaxID=1682393 RepID=A0A9P8XZ96_9PEZI|nr:uncharacterized protein B0I36DRAFT_30741 [Microdochium trichocladiopsis]KAH7021264.1 hypothetical protein B0I36DRAFT_30741 [Microdochium trichocladiopsis]
MIMSGLELRGRSQCPQSHDATMDPGSSTRPYPQARASFDNLYNDGPDSRGPVPSFSLLLGFPSQAPAPAAREWPPPARLLQLHQYHFLQSRWTASLLPLHHYRRAVCSTVPVTDCRHPSIQSLSPHAGRTLNAPVLRQASQRIVETCCHTSRSCESIVHSPNHPREWSA